MISPSRGPSMHDVALLLVAVQAVSSHVNDGTKTTIRNFRISAINSIKLFSSIQNTERCVFLVAFLSLI